MFTDIAIKMFNRSLVSRDCSVMLYTVVVQLSLWDMLMLTLCESLCTPMEQLCFLKAVILVKELKNKKNKKQKTDTYNKLRTCYIFLLDGLHSFQGSFVAVGSREQRIKKSRRLKLV